MRAVLLLLAAAVSLAVGAPSRLVAQMGPESVFPAGPDGGLFGRKLALPDVDARRDPSLPAWVTSITRGKGNPPKSGTATIMGSNAEGTRFMVGFMQNEINQTVYGFRYSEDGNSQQTISLASRFATTVTITAPGSAPLTVVLEPYVPQTIGVAMAFECLGESISRRGIAINATMPISVYCYSAKTQTSDGYLALPINSWGKEYVTSNFAVDHYTPDTNDWYGANITMRHGEFAVLAAEDSTVVTIWPTVQTLNGAMPGQPYRRRLNRGDIFQVQDGGESRGVEDLTGSVVTADKPIGLLSGHVRAGVPVQYDQGKDHLIEMIPPRNTLGKRYVIVPFTGRQGGDIVRVISAFEGATQVTIVTLSGAVRTENLVGVGDFYQINLREVSIVTASQPVLVTQYAQSASADPRNRGRVTVNFDPDMVVITPEEQFVNAAVFQTLPNYPREGSGYKQFDNHYVTIVAERKGFPSMMINGRPISQEPTLVTGDIPGTPFVWATIERPDAEVHVISGDALFGGYVYGLGEFDSYAWPVGSGLRKFDLPPDTIPPGLRSTKLCGVYEYFAQDSGVFASGLRRVWLDSSASTNVRFEQTLLIIGDEVSLGRLSLLDPRVSGRAKLIAMDLNGNTKEILVTLESTAPAFTLDGNRRDSLYFGILDVNKAGTQTLRITNTGTDTLRLDKVRLDRNVEFFFDNPQTYQNRVLNPGQSVDVKVMFITTVRKIHRDTLVVTSGCIDYRFPVAAVVPNPGILSGPVDFGAVRVGTPRTLKVTVKNTGQAALVIDRATISGTVFSTDFVRPFAVPLELAPGRDTSFDVTFRPANVIDYRDSITFYSNADSIETAVLTGSGIYPYLTIGGYDYGKVQVGRDSAAMVPMTNLGSDFATATGIRLETPDGFVTTPFPTSVVIAPGRSINIPVPVRFTPTDEKGYLTRIFLLNEDGLEASDTLRGAGYMLRAAIEGCDWETKWVGTSHDSVRYIRNLGKEPITITDVSIVAGDIGEFRIIDPIEVPVTLRVGESIPIPLQFSPLFRGQRSAKIRALTSSNLTPMIDADLLGFGLEAGASDMLDFDASLAYACGTRGGAVTIENTGNTDLTLAAVTIESDPNLVSIVDGPTPGDLIGAGENRQIEFTVDFAGHAGPVTGKITWSFEELAGTFSREFTIEGELQEHGILATTPPSVAIGGDFDLLVRVDKVHLAKLPEKRVTLEIAFNPTVARFDPERWSAYGDTSQGAWKSDGEPLVSGGNLILTLKPADAEAAMLDSVIFIPIPFRGFLGDDRIDTFQVKMTVGEGSCSPPSLASVRYEVDSICGLHQRLFELTGPPYDLAQNKPNPVHLKTQIDFTLGMDAETTLEVYTADGKLVATPISGALPAGEYSVPLDASDLPSGLYYYRLRSGPFSATRQMRVTK